MNSIFDLIGAFAVGGLVLITMTTTLYNVQYTSQDFSQFVFIYGSVQKSCDAFHNIFSMVALDTSEDSIFIQTDSTKFVFYSKWNLKDKNLDNQYHVYSLFLDSQENDFGKKVTLLQDGTDNHLYDYIFWLRKTKFSYLDADNLPTGDPKMIRTIQLTLYFKKSSTNLDKPDLNQQIVIWNYLKNISVK